MNVKLKSAGHILKIAFLFVGTIVGAGFASGKELVSFFGNIGYYIIPVAIFVAGLFFYTCWLFLKVGKLVQPRNLSDITKAMFKKGSAVMDAFIVISYFIVMAAMLAGIESIFTSALNIKLGFPLLSIITLIVSMFIAVRGINGLIGVNTILVPIVIVFVVAISTSGIFIGGEEVVRKTSPVMTSDIFFILANSILYVCMNMLLTAPVLGDAGRTLNKKTIFGGSLIGSLLICLCVLLILGSIYLNADIALFADMPLLMIASNFGWLVTIISSIIIWMGVFTTLTSSIYPIIEWSDKFIKKRYISVPIIAAIGFAISLLGFSAVIDYLYPVMGAIGLFFIIVTSIFYFRNPKKTFDISA